MKKKNLIKGLCVGALVCLSPLMFAGCVASDSSVNSLEEKIELLQQTTTEQQEKISELENKIDELENPTTETPEESETTTISISSNQEAYNVLTNAYVNSMFNEDGTVRNVQISNRYKEANELEWEDGNSVYCGTTDNNVSYQYLRYSWDDEYTDSLTYSNETGVYSVYFEYESESIEIGGTKYEYSTLKEYFDLSIPCDKIISYQQLENGNWEIKFEYTEANYDNEYSLNLSFYKYINTVVISEEGLMLSLNQDCYRSSVDNETAEQTVYVKVAEGVSELTYNVETPQKVYELLALADNIDYTTEE